VAVDFAGGCGRRLLKSGQEGKSKDAQPKWNGAFHISLLGSGANQAARELKKMFQLKTDLWNEAAAA
jgi:hypothetical protein